MVSPVLFKLLWAAGLFLLAIVLGVAGRYYFTNAELLCQRFAEGAERMPWILRLLSPPRFFRSRYAVWQLRSSGLAAIIGACILFIVEKIFEGPRFRRISRSKYRGDRQPDYDCVESSFHQQCFVPPACCACLVND